MKIGALAVIVISVVLSVLAAQTDILPWRLVSKAELQKLQADTQALRFEAQSLRAQLSGTQRPIVSGSPRPNWIQKRVQEHKRLLDRPAYNNDQDQSLFFPP